MKISEWLTIHTEHSPSGLTVSELIEHFRESTGSEDHKAELTRALSAYVIDREARTNRKLRFPQTLTSSDVVDWLTKNANVASIGEHRERIAELICRTSRIEPTLDNLNSVLIRLPAETSWQFKGFTFETWVNANTQIVCDLSQGDPSQRIAERYCRSQGLGYDSGTVSALCAELDRLHYVYGSGSFLKLNGFIV